jgi:hypothetical protein
MRIHLLGSLIAAAALAVPATASAGNLGKVTKAVSKKSGSSGGSSGGSSSGSTSTPDRDHRQTHVDYDDNYYTCTHNCGTVTYGGTGHAGPRVLGKPEIDLGFALHSVDDSDGAAVVSLRVSHGGFGIGVDDISYFEDLPLPDGTTGHIRMDLWTINMAGRIAYSDQTELWLTGGIAGARSTEFESLLGPVVGLAIDHHLGGAVSLQGSARLFFLEEDIDAREYRAGIKASVLTVGYRHLEFNVGPPLQGPEVGVQLSF